MSAGTCDSAAPAVVVLCPSCAWSVGATVAVPAAPADALEGETGLQCARCAAPVLDPAAPANTTTVSDANGVNTACPVVGNIAGVAVGAAAVASSLAEASAAAAAAFRPSKQVADVVAMLEALCTPRSAPEHGELLRASEFSSAAQASHVDAGSSSRSSGASATELTVATVRACLSAPGAVVQVAPDGCARSERVCARWVSQWLSELPTRAHVLAETRQRIRHLGAVLSVVDAHGVRLNDRVATYEAYLDACMHGGARAAAAAAAGSRSNTANTANPAAASTNNGPSAVAAAAAAAARARSLSGKSTANHTAATGSGPAAAAAAAASASAANGARAPLRWRSYTYMVLVNKGVIARVSPLVKPAELRALAWTFTELERGLYRLAAAGPAVTAGKVLPVPADIDLEQLLAIESNGRDSAERGERAAPDANFLILDETLAVDAVALLNRVIRKHFV